MTVYDLLKIQPHITTLMIRWGLLPAKYNNYMKMYRTYLEFKNLEECTVHKACTFTAKYYKVHVNTVYNAKNELETQIS